MRSGGWVRDTRPVRRVVADADAPVQRDEWPASIPTVAQVLRDGTEDWSQVQGQESEDGTT